MDKLTMESAVLDSVALIDLLAAKLVEMDRADAIHHVSAPEITAIYCLAQEKRRALWKAFYEEPPAARAA